jgi:Protein of unknown function (DUF3617)
MVRTGLAAGIAASIWLGSTLPVGAAELPIRRPGLWEIKIKLTGGAAPTAMMRHCTDESVDREMSTLFNPLAPPPCKESEVQKLADRYTVDATCKADNKTVTIHSDVTGDFAATYAVVTETKTQEQPDTEPTVSSMTLEGKHVGSCKWGQKPGDVVMAGGLKVNVKQMDSFKKMQRPTR